MCGRPIQSVTFSYFLLPTAQIDHFQRRKLPPLALTGGRWAHKPVTGENKGPQRLGAASSRTDTISLPSPDLGYHTLALSIFSVHSYLGPRHRTWRLQSANIIFNFAITNSRIRQRHSPWQDPLLDSEADGSRLSIRHSPINLISQEGLGPVARSSDLLLPTFAP